MVPKIAEGDMVLVRKTVVAEQGATVVCVNKGESMIKVLRKASGRDLILSSVNSAKHPPFLASGDFRIEGVVVGVISYHVG
jgi:repressor LexA